MATAMVTDETDEEHPLIKLALDTTLVVAGGSLFLYLAASSYLTGYLESFGCDAAWFDPSIFQLITFSKTAIFIAVALACGLWLLFELSPFSGGWWVTYLIWVLLQLGVASLCSLASALGGSALGSANLVLALLTAATPPVMALITRAQTKRHRSEVDEELSRHQEDDAELQKALEIFRERATRSPDEVRWAESYREQQLAVLTRVRADRTELHRKRRFTIVSMAAMTLYFALPYSTMCGVATAAMQFRTSRGAISEGAPDTRVEILFTDGVRTLTRSLRGADESVVFHNPEADLHLTLRVGSHGVLTLPQTRPSTLPSP
jgi:hypothetical protein